MIDLLNELTEIPFNVFWDKYLEIKNGNYNKIKAEKEWFYMKEKDRKTAFENIAKGHPAIGMFNEPYKYLEHWNLPF